MIHMREYNPFEKKNVQFLVNKRIDYTTIQITQTGINKGTLLTLAKLFLQKVNWLIISEL